MGVPTVLVNSATGSDTTASGAGPTTAISGSTGRTRNTASQLHFGFFGATDDFSAVTTDGTNVCFMSIATAGQRNHSSIAGIKNTRHVDVGSITSGAAILSGIVSTSGWTIGDVLKVTGAGAASADLYSTILTVDSGTQVTLNDNAGTTVVAAVVENPKQATLSTSQGVNTGTTNTAWAVGGKRASAFGANSWKLFDNNGGSGDAMPGWTVQMDSGHSETGLTAQYHMRRAGDTTSGLITLRGIAGAATMPSISWTLSGNINDLLAFDADYQAVIGFKITKTSANSLINGMLESTGSTNVLIIQGMEIFGSANSGPGIIFNQNAQSEARILGCYIHGCSGYGIKRSNTGGASRGVHIEGCYITGNVGGISIDLVNNSVICDNVIAANTAHGILVGSGCQGCEIAGNVIHGNTGTSDGINLSQYNGHIIENNNITANGRYGVNCAASVPVGIFTLDYNNYGTGATANTSGSVNNCTAGSHDLTVDPGYVATGSANYQGGANVYAKGYPDSTAVILGSGTTTFPDIGTSQPSAAPSGTPFPFPGGQIMGL